MAIKRIDLSGERTTWREVRYGRDVRAAGISSLQKTEDVINETVDEANQAAIDSQAASRDAQQALTDVAATLQAANAAKTSAQGSATAASNSAAAAAQSKTAAAESAASAAQSAAQAGAVAGFNGYANTVKAPDTHGILGTPGAELNVQAIIDEVSRRVTEEVLQKTDLISQIVNDPEKIASMAALYSVNYELTKLNSNIETARSTLGKTFWGGTETIITVANNWKQGTKSIKLPPGSYILCAHMCAPAGDNCGTIRIDNVPAVEPYQYFGASTVNRKVTLSFFYNFSVETTLTMSAWCTAAITLIECEVCAMRLK